jgi:hypothetical protein
MNTETLMLVVPFVVVGVALTMALGAHAYFDRRERRQHPAE